MLARLFLIRFLSLLLLAGCASAYSQTPPHLTALTLFGCDESGAVDERFRMNTGPVDAAWDVFLVRGESSSLEQGEASAIQWLNSKQDHTLDFVLEPGRHVFTLLTEHDQSWARSGLNLFFDGRNEIPGISAQVANTQGAQAAPEMTVNLSEKTMGWPIAEVVSAKTLARNTSEIGLRGVPPQGPAYQVRLVDFQLREPRAEAPIDLVGPHEIGSSGKPDWTGTLVLEVQEVTPPLSPLAVFLHSQAGFVLDATSPGRNNLSFPGLETIAPPFSFDLGGISFGELQRTWRRESVSEPIDRNRSRASIVWTDPETGLQVRWVGVEYRDYQTVEWTVYLKNTGTKGTPTISDLQGLNTRFDSKAGSEFRLHSNRGDDLQPSNYEPLVRDLGPGEEYHLAPTGGRPTNGEYPYFNLRAGSEGVIAVVGWPGQWAATFERDPGKSLSLIAGQEKTSFILHPGEEVRTPLIVLQFSEGGDWIDAQNKWRRWMIEYNLPRPDGKPLKLPGFAACSSHQFAEMTKANERNQIEFIDSYLEKGLKIDYWWMDAGWYVGAAEKNWPWTGTWEVDRRPHRFPNGLRAVSDHAHSKGVDIIVWFEPERVAEGTWLATEHPEWILGKKGGLLNLGNPEAWSWLVNHIDKIITDEGIDLYRQDFNIDPLKHWRENDTPDRIGITENKYVVGYLAYWDELLRRHPGMLIDSCASGGRRNDLETLRRAVPLLRSDYLFEPVGQQCHTYGLALWVPFFGTAYAPSNTVGWGWGTGGVSYDPYTRRSNMCPNNTACFDFRVPVDDDLLLKLYREWVEVAPNFFGDYYPLSPYSLSQTDWMAWQFHRPEEGAGMVQAFRREDNSFFGGQFRMRGLDSKATYEIHNMDEEEKRVATGQQLMEEGLEVAIRNRPGAAVVSYKRIPD
jgi:alpha-galactosidase